MPDDKPQKALWEVRKAGLNIMMSLKGDGKPVSFIEDCAVPLEHLAEYTDALTEVFARATARAAPGTPMPRWARCMCGPSWTCAATARRRAQDARHRRRSGRAGAPYKGAYSGEHGDGLCRGEWVAWQFGPRLNEAFEQIKDLFDPPAC
jgi:FAD/FMN-containing dehydrogenase